MSEKNNNTLSEAGKAARREYLKKWQHDHPEAVKEYTRKYWEKKGAELLANRDTEANN